MPVGSHTSGWFTCCLYPELASLLELQPGYEAVMTAFVMIPAWVEANIPNRETLCHLLFSVQQRYANHFQ